jgi:hypothetical protein
VPPQDQLEIIRSSGEIEFYNLDPGKGITNIGRHPENDIVLVSPGVAAFHAVLDHRQKPYQLVVLSQESPTTLGGQILPSNVSTPLHDWDAIQFDGHTLVLLENGHPAVAPPMPTARLGMPSPPPPEITGRPPTGFPPPTTRPEEFVTPPSVPIQFFTTTPPDITSEAILIEMPEEREQIVDVEQPANYNLTIVNGGSIVATFIISVVGVDRNWVVVSPAHVNLFEGERAPVTISIIPPRRSTSLAGPHPFAIVVSSPNYPGQTSRRGAMLNINPYYDFAVSELTPKRQTISWFKPSGEVYVSITNRGNSEALFRVEGEDDERACSFEFTIPDEAVGLARQVDVRIPPDETMSIPVAITPHSRRLIGLRKRTHSFTMTTTLLEGQQTPRSLLGELKQAPLIGPLLIFLMIFLTLAAIFYIFWPKAHFIVNPSSITAGQDVTLAWNASPALFVTIKLNGEPAESPRGTLKEELYRTTVYELTADTWLSKLFPALTDSVSRPVEVTPVRPYIGLFQAQPEETLSGQPVILSWFVVGADELTLTDNTLGKADTLTNPAGSRQLIPDQDTTYTLSAVNASAPDEPVEKLAIVRVSTPTPVIPDPPVIEYFMAAPQVISAGQSVTLQWAVSNAESVSVKPLGDNLPPVSPPINHWPQETTLYVLSASNGEQTVNAIQQVVVGQAPTPTPEPTPGAAPTIELLSITPEEWVRVEPERDDKDNEIEVQINWVVTGDTTNVELTGGPPGYEKLSNLSRIGQVKLKVMDTTVFVLTASNGDAQAVKTTQIKFLDPTPTPEPTSAADEDTDGDDDETTAPEIASFTAEGVSPSDQVTAVGGDPPVYQVVAGSNVNLRWSVNDANTVTLVGVGEQPPAGTHTLSNVVADQIFQLTAEGDGGTTQAFLQLQVVNKPTPPQPFDVNGTENAANEVTLTWDYDAENDIIGFRVYRDNGSGFLRVADESTLINSTRQWFDSAGAAICRGYYVTAVYIEPISGNKAETAASTNSWYSSSCP